MGLTKCAKVMWFFKIFIFPKKVTIKGCTKETKITFRCLHLQWKIRVT